MPSLVKVLFKIIEILNRQKIPYMLVGGLAVNYYGAPRATGDIDLSVSVNSGNLKNLLPILKKAKFILHEKEIKSLLKISNHFLVFDPSNTYRIDCWMPKTNFELQALKRRIKTKIAGRKVYLPAVEDLILFKLLAGRTKDKEDLKWIIERQKAILDKKHLKFWSIALNVHKSLRDYIKTR